MSRGNRRWLIGAAGGAVMVVVVVAWAIWTGPERAAVQTYTALITAANRQDAAAARHLCTRRYAAAHALERASEGGLVGLPRNIHMRFQVWRRGPHVWLCPTNRVGPVFQFVREQGSWKFDGPVGLLQSRGQFVPMTEDAELLEPSE